MNIGDSQTTQQVSNFLKEISAPARIRILLAIGKDEVCVCHLTATLGLRQAYLSQHLMALRQAGILITNRDGRFINYRLANPKILDVINSTADYLNVSLDEGRKTSSIKKPCPCPRCKQSSEDVLMI